jgi:hypothetical protein
MKGYATLLFLSIALMAFCRQSIHLQRHLEIGRAETFTVHFSGSAIFGDLDVTQTTSSKVTAIDKDGNADVQFAIQSRKVLVNDSEISTKLDAPYSRKINKDGIPIMEAKDFDRNDFLSYLEVLFDRDLEVGEVIPINQLMPNGKEKATGNLKLLSLNEGRATFDAVITVPRGSQLPTVLKGKIVLSTKDGSLEKIDATVKNLDLGQALLTDAKYAYSRADGSPGF